MFDWAEKYKKIDRYALVGFLLLTIVGLMIFWRVPVFTPLLAVYTVYFFISRKSFSLPYCLWPILVIIASYGYGLLVSDKFYYQNQQDLLNVVISFAMGFMMWNVMKDEKSINTILKDTLITFFYIAALLSIIGIIKFFCLFFDYEFAALVKEDMYPFGTNLVRNYNNNALAGSLGCLAGVYAYRQTKNQKLRLLHVILISSIVINIISSGSRRLFLLLCIALGAMILVLIVKLFSKSFRESIKRNWIPVTYIAVFSLTLGISSWNFMVRMTPHERLEWVKNSSFSTDRFTKEFLKPIFRYKTLAAEKSRMGDFYFDFWGTKYVKTKKDRSAKVNAYIGRVQRFNYAHEVFQSYNPIQKAVGNGFAYIDLFRIKFLTPMGIDKDDYPHQFYLSALLYSGYIGLILLLLFTFYFVAKLYKVLRRYPEYVGMVLLVFYNVLFSYNSIFSLRLFVILMVLTLVVEQRLKKSNESSIAGS